LRGRLFEAARSKRDLIRGIIEKLRSGEPPLTNVRIENLPSPSPRGSRLPHAAEDGGSRLVEFEAYSVFIVRGWASSYGGEGGSYGTLVEAEYSDVGVMVPQRYSEERARMYRETLEALAARDVLPAIDGGLLLWDGSLRPLVARHRPGVAEVGMSEAISELKGRLGMDLAEALAEMARLWLEGEAPAAPLLVSSRVGVDDLKDEDGGWIAFLEWTEKLAALRSLLEEAWRRGVTPVFITKTSRSTSFFGRSLPDVYYLKRLRRFDPFMTEYRVRRGLEELRGLERSRVRGPLLPEDGGLDSFYRERLGLLEFYVRLDPGAPILKVEIAFDLEEGGDPGASVERVVSALESLPRARGYPLSLTIAHRRAHLGSEEVERILDLLGLELERRERWML